MTRTQNFFQTWAIYDAHRETKIYAIVISLVLFALGRHPLLAFPMVYAFMVSMDLLVLRLVTRMPLRPVSARSMRRHLDEVKGKLEAGEFDLSGAFREYERRVGAFCRRDEAWIHELGMAGLMQVMNKAHAEMAAGLGGLSMTALPRPRLPSGHQMN